MKLQHIIRCWKSLRSELQPGADCCWRLVLFVVLIVEPICIAHVCIIRFSHSFAFVRTWRFSLCTFCVALRSSHCPRCPFHVSAIAFVAHVPRCPRSHLLLELGRAEKGFAILGATTERSAAHLYHISRLRPPHDRSREHHRPEFR